jgi:eukaryotic-like serine/threonine-protein kinase
MPVEPASPEGREGAFPLALGKYVPFARLGRGGMADVFLAVARGPGGFNKIAVVKRLRNPDDASHVEMFLDEARVAARLNHPNVVHTYEVGASQQRYFIAMEYLEGQSLQALSSRLSAQSEGLSEPVIAYIATQVLKGLDHAHELRDFDGTPLGMVHRDISPQNLHLTYGGEVKVLDFGIAKTAMSVGHTETGILKGKIRYMSPEQIAGREVDRRADLFAFGVVLWELLARRPLFHGDAAAVMSRIVNEDAPGVREFRPDVSPALEAIALKALRREPQGRYATADEMRSALEDFLRDRREPALDRQLARIMNDTFAATRDDVRARMKAFLDRTPSGDDGAHEGDRHSDLPVLLEGSGPHTPPATSGSVATVRPMPRWTWLLLAVGVSAASVIALARLGREIQTPPVQAASLAPAVGHLRLVTQPPGALVERDGETLGRTPVGLALATGATTLRVSLDGYESDTVTFDVQQGAALERSITLRPEIMPTPPRALVPTTPAASSSALAASTEAPGSAPPPPVPPQTHDAPILPLPAAPRVVPPRPRIKVLDD